MNNLSSLRLRLLGYATAIVAVALLVTGFGLASLFERFAERRTGHELDVYLSQIAGGLRFDDAGEVTLTHYPADPRFTKVFGGLYWQVSKAGEDVVLRSRSLWDAELILPEDALRPGQTHTHTELGPTQTDVLIHETAVVVPTKQGNQQMRIAVAVDANDLMVQVDEFNDDMMLGLGVLGVVLLVGFAVQIREGLKPMQALRENIAQIRNGEAKRLKGPVPAEVAPLVDEVNALLELQEQDMIRARDRAADLAHGLKTPLTALASDVLVLREKGETDLAASIEDLAAKMRRHMDREMVRARHRHGRYAQAVVLQPALQAIVRTLERMPQGRTLQFIQQDSGDLGVAMDPDDLNDVFGNLLENAVRFARSKICIGITQQEGRVQICIEDDGEGLSPEQIDLVTQRGKRLDTQGAGAGLGLAIVCDIVEANDGKIRFDSSPMGGLRITVDVKAGPKTT
jgi:signal transduction histidine kinase